MLHVLHGYIKVSEVVSTAVSSASSLFFEGLGNKGGECGKPTCYREQIRKNGGKLGSKGTNGRE